MMVIRAETLGFCMGVRRAVAAAYATARAGGRTYTLGALIHNPQVSEALAELGVQTLEAEDLPADLRGATVILRAHGVAPALEADLAARGARIADATCPRVKAGQVQAKALADAGCRLLLAGEKRHPEVIGMQGYAPGCVVVETPHEARSAAERLAQSAGKTALIGQTTISADEYRRIAEAVRQYIPEVTVIDSLCGAVQARQSALKRLCAAADAVVIVGSRTSANTRRLLETAQAQGKPAWLAESPGDLPADIAAYPVVGLSAGASAPDDLIDAVETILRSQAD